MKTTHFSMTHDGTFTWAALSCKDTTGWEAASVIGRHFSEFIIPEELPAMIENRKKRLPGRTIEYFTYIILKDGTPCRAVVKALDTPENTVGSVTVLDDVLP